MTTGLYIFIAMVGFVFLLTLIGLVHMIRHNCRVRCRHQCCFSCKEEEKEDINLDYGTYYSADGERRDNIMEVSVVFLSILLSAHFPDTPNYAISGKGP